MLHFCRNRRIFSHGISKINQNNFRFRSHEENCEGTRRCDKSVINPQNLPLLPIPKLENTLAKFLKSCEPFVSYQIMHDAKKISDLFEQREGRELQKYLICKAQKTHNWLEEWYTQSAYLRNRNSLPMCTSIIVTFPSQKFSNKSDQKDYTAKLILAVLKFRKLIHSNEFPVDTWHKHPLDMGVYMKLFSNIRLPKPKCDRISHFPNSHHIIVIFKNKFFKVMVSNNCGDHLSYKQIMERLHEIMLKDKSTGIPFGLLTSLKRDAWASVYKYMKDMGPNDELLEDIEKALFVVNIDNTTPCPDHSDEDKKLNACQNGFHGYGPKINGANRWYDKTLQFFITRDGYSGIIFEHSPVETRPLGRMTDYIIDSIHSQDWQKCPDVQIRERPVAMEFEPSKLLTIFINEASEQLEESIKDFRVNILHYDRFGKNFIKENNLSPDAVIQACLQHANIKTHKKIVPQHETASTRRFFLGRTDTIRSCTNELITFLKNVSKASLSAREKYELLHAAVRRHKHITEDVMMGKGIDCHLFGLKMAAQELKMATPALFECEAYKRSGSFRIVTRQNATKRNCFTCYAPGLSGGYGCCYNPRSEDVNMCVTCRKSDSECNPEKFLEAWAGSMKEISDLLMIHKHQELKIPISIRKKLL